MTRYLATALIPMIVQPAGDNAGAMTGTSCFTIEFNDGSYLKSRANSLCLLQRCWGPRLQRQLHWLQPTRYQLLLAR